MFEKNYKSQDFRSCNKNLEEEERKPDVLNFFWVFFFYCSLNPGFPCRSKHNFNAISVFPSTLFPLTQAPVYSLHYVDRKSVV